MQQKEVQIKRALVKRGSIICLVWMCFSL